MIPTNKCFKTHNFFTLKINLWLIENHKLNKEKEYTLTSADEADPSEGKISVSSPFAQGLLGAKEGDTVVIKLPAGDKKVTILKIAYK